jgi:hypothetical protein
LWVEALEREGDECSLSKPPDEMPLRRSERQSKGEEGLGLGVSVVREKKLKERSVWVMGTSVREGVNVFFFKGEKKRSVTGERS